MTPPTAASAVAAPMAAPGSSLALGLEPALAACLRSLAGKNRSAATIRAYRTDVLQFIIWLHENNLVVITPGQVAKIDITEYLAVLADRRVSGTSRARKVAAIREYFRFCE